MKFNRSFFINLVITATIAMLTQATWASSFLWATSGGLGASGVAATFNITGGVTSNTSNGTTITYYTDAGCNTFAGSTRVTGTYTFRNPSTVYANGTSIFNIIQSTGRAPDSVFSIKIIPDNSGINLFTTTPCFVVSCSGSECNSSTVENVTLQ